MDTDDTHLDDELRATARRSLDTHVSTVDPDRELAEFSARLDDEHGLIRVEPSTGRHHAIARVLPMAAVAVAIVAVGVGVFAVTRDVDERIGSPSTTAGVETSLPSTVATAAMTSPDAAVRDSTPRSTAVSTAFSIGGGFNILPYPKVAFADTPADLADVLAGVDPPVDIDALGLDWGRYAVVGFARPTDACPSVFAGITVASGVLTPEFTNPGYQGCILPLLSHTALVAVDRDALTTVDRIELPAIPPFFDTPISIPIAASPSTAPSGELAEPDDAFGTVRGSMELPEIGAARLASLDDGSPLIVIRHHDDTVTAARPWVASAESDAAPQLVAWIAATRTFLGSGAWDEYGRRLDGPRSTDLITYATRVVEDRVEIGDAVPAPTGSPIGRTEHPPADVDLTIRPDNRISLEDALALPAGQTRWIDASLVIDPSGARLCTSAGFQGSLELPPCPVDSPTADGVAATPGSRTIWFGPLLGTRTATGFTDIVPTGGSASSIYGEGLPPPVPAP